MISFLQHVLPRKIPCTHCGNNPTNHLSSYLNETAGLLLAPFDEKFMNTRFGFAFRSFYTTLNTFVLTSMTWAGIASFHTDPTILPSKRGKVLFNEAVKRQIPIEGLKIYGKPLDMYRTLLNGKRVVFAGLPREEKRFVQTRIDDKAHLKKILLQAGLPASPGGRVSSPNDALKLFSRLEKPVIVKPALGSRGRHTTTHIYTETDLLRAFACAQKICHFVVVEEHLHGSVYRGTVVGGKLAGVLRGDPPRITGNGTDTIETLIQKKNETRDPRISEVALTPLLTAFLGRQGFALTDVLPKGITIDLSEKIGIGYGGSSKEMLHEVHPDVRSALEKAAALLNDDILGFDFIIPDPTQDPTSQKWGIIECNAVPFINLHHDPIEGAPVNVAARIWDLYYPSPAADSSFPVFKL